MKNRYKNELLRGPLSGPILRPLLQRTFCRMLFPDPFLHQFRPPGTSKIIVFSLVFNDFSEIRLPASGPQEAPQNEANMVPKCGPGGLQSDKNQQ